MEKTTGAVEYLSEADVARLLQLGRRTVRRFVKVGLLPKPLKLGSGRCAKPRWFRTDVDEAMRKLRDGSAPPRCGKTQPQRPRPSRAKKGKDFFSSPRTP
jgi:predicted DNA-binding transcriptional regulator AlpA